MRHRRDIGPIYSSATELGIKFALWRVMMELGCSELGREIFHAVLRDDRNTYIQMRSTL